jgi:hypothetical protein
LRAVVPLAAFDLGILSDGLTAPADTEGIDRRPLGFEPETVAV